MDGIRFLVLLWIFAASTTAFFIYEPSNNPVEEKESTIAELISKGFTFNGFAREDNAQLALSKVTIKKRAIPVSL